MNYSLSSSIANNVHYYSFTYQLPWMILLIAVDRLKHFMRFVSLIDTIYKITVLGWPICPLFCSTFYPKTLLSTFWRRIESIREGCLTCVNVHNCSHIYSDVALYALARYLWWKPHHRYLGFASITPEFKLLERLVILSVAKLASPLWRWRCCFWHLLCLFSPIVFHTILIRSKLFTDVVFCVLIGFCMLWWFLSGRHWMLFDSSQSDHPGFFPKRRMMSGIRTIQ